MRFLRPCQKTPDKAPSFESPIRHGRLFLPLLDLDLSWTQVLQQFAELDQFWPDMQEGSAACTVSFICRDAPGGVSYTVGPIQFAIADELVPLNIATREFQIRIGGAQGRWELGLPLLSMQGGSLR